ncbi:MAG: FtsH protease activity modulator HflK [Lachnospiraceae bacterium]|nr:FtsH protease activity modulator HflK [Lachnospiraceae bacterium]
MNGQGFTNPFTKTDENGDVYQRQPSGSGKGVLRVILGILLVVLVIFLGSAAFYNVGEQEQAVLTMFGRIVRTDTAGLYFKIPLLQRVHKVDMTTHGIGIGYLVDGGQNITVEEEGIMITSDFNFVDIDFYLEYKVSDPVAYLYNTQDPENTMKNMALACIRSTVINYPVDEVITTAKGQIQAEVKEKLQAELADKEVGLMAVNVSVQDAEPPTPEIVQAFKEVETAKQGKETAVNNAKKYQNEQIPRAEANADKITQQAEADKAARIAEAEGQVERFSQMYQEYQKYPLITKQRMFYEAMEDVLPGLKVIITDGNTQELLPIESFYSDGTAAESTVATGSDAAETEAER